MTSMTLLLLPVGRLSSGSNKQFQAHSRRRCGAMDLSKRHSQSPWNAVSTQRRKMAATSMNLEHHVEEMDQLVEESDDSGQKFRSIQFQHRLNKASKWLVSAATGAVILWRHDEHALWAFCGAVVNGGVCKALKYAIRDKRPESADGRKRDPGMPSSHAQGFMYLCTYGSLGLLSWQGLSLSSIAGACGLSIAGTYLAWLRVADGLHTMPQVLVGGTLGSLIATFWFISWRVVLKSIVESNPSSVKHLLIVSLFTGFMFFLTCMRDWRLGEF